MKIHAIACIAALGLAFLAAAPALAVETADYPAFELVPMEPVLVAADAGAVGAAFHDADVLLDVALGVTIEVRGSPPDVRAAVASTAAAISAHLADVRLGGGAVRVIAR